MDERAEHLREANMTTTNRRRFLTLASATLAAPAFSRRVLADDWPKDRLIRVTIPFNAGSTIDIIGRIVSDPLSRRLGQTIIIENRGGAGGTLGSLQVARADPDGYTLLINAAAHSNAPAAYPKLPYDAANDFAGVGSIGSVPNVLVVAKSKGIKSVEELVAKAKVSDMNFSSSGVGSATHWAAERFRISAGFKATHIPFRGGVEALTEVMTGRVDFCCMGISSAMPFIKEGSLLPLVVTSLKRSPSLPGVMTSLEAGYKDSDFNYWNGLLVPAKTPRSIIDRLHAELTAVLAMPDVQDKLDVQGVEPAPLTPTEMDAMIRKEIALNLKLAKELGLVFN
jgi:tripartite-type tricarboxylate transporter receptor subunit TctC